MAPGSIQERMGARLIGAPLEHRAVVAVEAADGSSPSSAVGPRYLLEVRLAREAVEVWLAWRPGRTPSLEDKLEAVTFYAEHDAWLPVE